MPAPTKLFLDKNVIDSRWKILDNDGMCYGEGETPEQAIRSARVVTNAAIYANSDFKGIIDGKPTLENKNVEDLSEDSALYGSEEIIEAMAELGGFKVYRVYDEDRFLMGYTMELVE